MFFPPFSILAESTFQKLNGICSVQAFPRYWYMHFNVKKTISCCEKYTLCTHTLWRAKIVANEALWEGSKMRNDSNFAQYFLNYRRGRQLAIFVVNYSFQIFKFAGFLNSSLFVGKNCSNLLGSFELISEDMCFSSLL